MLRSSPQAMKCCSTLSQLASHGLYSSLPPITCPLHSMAPTSLSHSSFRYPSFFCQPRIIAGVFLISVALIGLVRFIAADTDWTWIPLDSSGTGVKDKAAWITTLAARFTTLHDQFPLLQERIHRKPVIQLVGFLLPIAVFFGGYSHVNIRYVLRPYILLSGAHLAGFVISTALLGPGPTVIYSFLFSILRALQTHQLLMLPETSWWAREGFRGIARHAMTVQIGAGDPPPSRTTSLLRGTGVLLRLLPRAMTYLLRHLWSLGTLLLLLFSLWATNALLLGWHLLNVFQGFQVLLRQA